MRPLTEAGWTLSAAPLIGPMMLPVDFLERAVWVIASGEQGPRRDCRDMKLSWSRSLRDQCRTAGIAFFMKQRARKAPLPPDLLIWEYPRVAPVDGGGLRGGGVEPI
jgi:protein gp37